MLPDQLDYIELLMSEEPRQAQQQQEPRQAVGVSMFHRELQELEPCNPEWNPPNDSGSLFAPLEDENPSVDGSPMHRYLRCCLLATGRLPQDARAVYTCGQPALH